MKTFWSIIGGGLITALVIGIIAWNTDAFKCEKCQNPAGSVSTASEYQSTVTKSGGTQTAVLSTTGGTVGSIIIPATMLGNLNIYDATTTDVTKRALATSSLRVVASVDAGTTVGTYTFDAIARQGILYDYSTVSSSTITWRQY